jgi:FPC/CPF motif-containing protein YcgG
MAMFAKLSLEPGYRKHNIAVFFEPDDTPLTHDEYHDLFWDTLQYLHDQDPDPEVTSQPDPSDESWEFSFGGVQMFVVCACPSFSLRHSRNLGPGMVLLFQPRSVFVDTITNKVIGRQARHQVRERLRQWDDVPPHGDLGFYGDSGNLEWKQYFLADQDQSARERCPFLSRGGQMRSSDGQPGVSREGPRHPRPLDEAVNEMAEPLPEGQFADRK